MQRGTTNSLLAIEIGAGLRGGGGPPAAGARSWWLTGITQPDELGVGRGRRAAQGVVVVAPNFPFSTPTDIGFSGQPAPAAQRPGRGRGGGRGDSARSSTPSASPEPRSCNPGITRPGHPPKGTP